MIIASLALAATIQGTSVTRSRGVAEKKVSSSAIPASPREKGPPINHLANETSPYLKQHAKNPINWYPWGKEALDKARKQNKPIWISIGYSTCHWCHVMNAESFSDKDIGALMNASFIAIKVDREERPDVDSTYMAVARKLMSDPGWPLNVILTPDGKPFFAAAYIPKDRLATLLTNLSKTWKEHPEQIASTASMVMQSLAPDTASAEIPGPELLKKTYDQFAERFDESNGGFNPPPKLPAGHQLMFLLRYWRRTGEPHALEMVETTLRNMRAGAIWDAKRGGFHRYAVDAEWKQPHYEKMLCDQALIAMAYLEAFQATHKPEYAATARAIFAYVLRDLRAPNGAFYAANDSDERTARDEKILTDWNGLMIAALSQGAAVLDDASYALAARRAANVLIAKVKLQHSDKQQAVFLDDYTFLIWGLLNLYEATFQVRYLERAIKLQRESLTRFRDATGRFYLTTSNDLLLRPRETTDGALPSGNSVQLANLVRLSRITGEAVYEKAANDVLRTTADEITLIPSASAHLMSGLDFLLGPSFEIVLAGADVRTLQRALFVTFVPNKVVLHSGTDIAAIAPFTALQRAIGGRATAYVCTNHLCRLPTADPMKVDELLESHLSF
ncbi:MAG TPA: thioredoxin domain-containing protein [Thermoanaerobaculia bacterium]|nr:thioredoxin domain-containing protein [Thermoanaerobaculia bacterium]